MMARMTNATDLTSVRDGVGRVRIYYRFDDKDDDEDVGEDDDEDDDEDDGEDDGEDDECNGYHLGQGRSWNGNHDDAVS